MSDESTDIYYGKGGMRLLQGLYSEEAATPLPPAVQYSYSAKADPANANEPSDIKAPETVNPLDYLLQWQGNKIFFWGTQNDYPDKLDAESRRCNILESGLRILGNVMQGQGIYLYKDVFKDGVREQEEVDDPEMYDWLYRIQYEKYFNKACHLLPRWDQVVPVYRMNEEGKLAHVHIIDTFYVRMEKPNPTTGYIENIYASGQWHRGVQWAIIASGDIPVEYRPQIQKYPLLKDFDPAVQMAAAPEIKEWAQWFAHFTTGNGYSRAPWHACYENRWTAISASAAAMKMRLSEAAMTINYMIGVHEDYWTSKYPDWKNNQVWSKEKKEDTVKEFQQSIEDLLAGKEQAFKSLFYSMYNSRKDGSLIKAFSLEVVDNKMRDSVTFIPDVQLANAEILAALGIDMSMIGLIQPGGNGNGGAGAPIREAWLALTARLKPDRDIIDQAYYVGRDYTWPKGEKKDIKIGHRDYAISTLDGRAPKAGAVTKSN